MRAALILVIAMTIGCNGRSSSAPPPAPRAMDAAQGGACATSTDEQLEDSAPGRKAHMRGEVAVRRVEGLPNVAMLTSSNAGTSILRGVFAGCVYAPRDQMFGPELLGALGWKALAAADRERLATTYVTGVLLYGSRVLDTAAFYPDAPGRKPFQPPRATTNADGSTSVTMWISDELRTMFSLVEYVIAPDGSVRNHAMDTFHVN